MNCTDYMLCLSIAENAVCAHIIIIVKYIIWMRLHVGRAEGGANSKGVETYVQIGLKPQFCMNNSIMHKDPGL